MLGYARQQLRIANLPGPDGANQILVSLLVPSRVRVELLSQSYCGDGTGKMGKKCNERPQSTTWTQERILYKTTNLVVLNLVGSDDVGSRGEDDGTGGGRADIDGEDVFSHCGRLLGSIDVVIQRGCGGGVAMKAKRWTVRGE